MIRLRRKRTDDAPLGLDSFLDIIANLVGVVIILVVVLGSRTQEEAVLQRAERDNALIEIDDGELETHKQAYATATKHAMDALADTHRLERELQASKMHLAMAAQQRGQLTDLLTIAKQAWADKQQELSTASVERGKTEAELERAERELETLQAVRGRAEAAPQDVVAVSHLPTPMAKTVFGEEVHFRLKAGRLAVVPLDGLLNEIHRDMQRKLTQGRDGVADSAVGPIQGFVAHYEMEKTQESVSRGGQIGTATRVQLVGLVVTPLQEPHGQPLGEVLQATSGLLDVELAGRPPGTTTVTVWVYPDSFAEFRQLKEHLYQRGFATAARPLPMDRPIAGGPQGSKSLAQ